MKASILWKRKSNVRRISTSWMHFHHSPLLHFVIVLYFNFIFFWPHCVTRRILVPDQGLNSCLLQWKLGVLRAGWPGKSLVIVL